MNAFNEFLKWESSSRDTIDFKRAYVDVAGDVLAGLVLSEIVYWHLPTRSGKSKLRISRDDYQWIACPRDEWWERVRLTPRQVDSALGKLIDAGIVIKAIYKFGRNPTTHVRIDETVFLERLTTVVTVDRNRYYKSVKSPIRDNQEITDPLKPRKSPKAQEPIPATTITEITNTQITDDAAKAASPKNARKKQDKPADPNAPLIQSLIHAWLTGIKSIDSSAYANKTTRKQAQSMIDAGVTAELLTEYITGLMRDTFWRKNPPTFGAVLQRIGVWMADRAPRPAAYDENDVPPPPPSTLDPNTRLPGGLTAAEFDALSPEERLKLIDRITNLTGRIVDAEGERRDRHAARAELTALIEST